MMHKNLLGPQIEKQVDTYISPPLMRHLHKCERYVFNLPQFSQFLIWRYTIGSASINSYLIFDNFSSNSAYWVQLFFDYFQNTFGETTIRIPYRWRMFAKYLYDSNSYKIASTEERQRVAETIIPLYIESLYNIISNAPVVEEEFKVYKASSNYPGLPLPDEPLPKIVKQMPFNSTTINPMFNFAIFLSEDAQCCLFEINIKPGNKVLPVPYSLHAYPFEREIILAPNVNFIVTDQFNVQLNAIMKSDVNIIQIQPKKIVMGPVYEISEFKPCLSNACNPLRKTMRAFSVDLSIH
jgi:hypothetical protein